MESGSSSPNSDGRRCKSRMLMGATLEFSFGWQV